jgi:hypothetical protein
MLDAGIPVHTVAQRIGDDPRLIFILDCEE